ncbi:hypothetical protein [Sphaerisporangium aureirubrum]|uniref:Uncharacterized protein n=1 Tax=Sphaerisporangium aureirubrum TaxID=1544736 RepID=A0ABW1ND37_9ACTN
MADLPSCEELDELVDTDPIRLRDAAFEMRHRAEQAEAEVARLRAGESEDPPTEGVRLTPAEWIRMWNDATPERRLHLAALIDQASATQSLCVLADHEGALRQLRDVEETLARVRRLEESYTQALARDMDPVVKVGVSTFRDHLRDALDGPALLRQPATEETDRG